MVLASAFACLGEKRKKERKKRKYPIHEIPKWINKMTHFAVQLKNVAETYRHTVGIFHTKLIKCNRYVVRAFIAYRLSLVYEFVRASKLRSSKKWLYSNSIDNKLCFLFLYISPIDKKSIVNKQCFIEDVLMRLKITSYKPTTVFTKWNSCLIDDSCNSEWND